MLGEALKYYEKKKKKSIQSHFVDQQHIDANLPI